MLYAPPANPSPVVNPILIIVVKEVANVDAKTITSKCEARVASEKGGEECRAAVMELFGNGQSMNNIYFLLQITKEKVINVFKILRYKSSCTTISIEISKSVIQT